MSVKNNRRKLRKANGYPLPERTVLFSRKKNMQPVPEVGKKYHCFVDGKITFSRHFIIKVDEVLGSMAFKKKYPEYFEQYRKAVKREYWLYSTHSDKFIIAHSGGNSKPEVYVRTKQGGWFGIGYYLNTAELDVTGKFWEYLVANIDNFNYSQEEKEKLIKENTIC